MRERCSDAPPAISRVLRRPACASCPPGRCRASPRRRILRPSSCSRAHWTRRPRTSRSRRTCPLSREASSDARCRDWQPCLWAASRARVAPVASRKLQPAMQPDDQVVGLVGWLPVGFSVGDGASHPSAHGQGGRASSIAGAALTASRAPPLRPGQELHFIASRSPWRGQLASASAGGDAEQRQDEQLQLHLTPAGTWSTELLSALARMVRLWRTHESGAPTSRNPTPHRRASPCVRALRIADGGASTSRRRCWSSACACWPGCCAWASRWAWRSCAWCCRRTAGAPRTAGSPALQRRSCSRGCCRFPCSLGQHRRPGKG